MPFHIKLKENRKIPPQTAAGCKNTGIFTDILQKGKRKTDDIANTRRLLPIQYISRFQILSAMPIACFAGAYLLRKPPEISPAYSGRFIALYCRFLHLPDTSMKHFLLPLAFLLAACDEPAPPPPKNNADNPLIKMQDDTVKKVEEDLNNAVRQQQQAIDGIDKP